MITGYIIEINHLESLNRSFKLMGRVEGQPNFPLDHGILINKGHNHSG